MTREETRQALQSQLDTLFPDGANCFVGDYQLQCPRPMVMDIDDDDNALVLIWAPGTQANTIVTIDYDKVPAPDSSGLVEWEIPRETDVVTISNYVPPRLAGELKPHRYDIPEPELTS